MAVFKFYDGSQWVTLLRDSDISSWAKQSTKPSYSWSEISSKPSTFTPSSHTHTKSEITDFPSSMPASDVYSWAKASSKPSYTASEVGALKNYGTDVSRPNGATFTFSTGANPVQMRSGATSGADIGIFYLSDDNAFVSNSGDSGYNFAVFDCDITADFTDADNAAFAVLQASAGVKMKGDLTVAGSISEGGTSLSNKYQAKGTYAGTAVATTSANGLMSSTDKSRVDTMWNVWSADDGNDTLVNKVQEVLTAFSNFPEASTLVGVLATKSDTNHNHDSTYLKLTGGTLSGYLNIAHLSNTGEMPALAVNYNNNNGNDLGEKGINCIKFGTIDNYIGQVPASRSHLGVSTFGLHTDSSHGFEFLTTAWTWVATLTPAGVFNAKAGLQVNGTNVCLTNDSRLSDSRPASDVYSWAKASTKPSYSWSEITDKPSSFTPSSHDHYSLVTEGDNRYSATAPNDYANTFVFKGLKINSNIGSPSSDTFSYLFGLRGWSDNSGGLSHELAFNNNGIYHRVEGSSNTWGSWSKIAHTSDIPSLSGYATQSWVEGKGYSTFTGYTSSNKLSTSYISGLATVATSGSYNDLSNKPTIPSTSGLVPYTNATSNVDLNGHSLTASSVTAGYIITQKSTTSGSSVEAKAGSSTQSSGYAKLFTTDGEQGEGKLSLADTMGTATTFTNAGITRGSYTLSFPSLSANRTIATTNDIPTNTNQLTNGAGYITSSGSCASATSSDNVTYLTTAPSSANTSGQLKFVVLSSEPSTKYSGYIYIITA